MTNYDQLAAALPDADAQPSPAPALYAVADTDPEAEAGLRRLSKSTGLPVESLRLKPVADEARRTDTVNRYDKVLRDSPKTASFLQDPIAAAVSHDDVENMSWMERIITNLDDRSFRLTVAQEKQRQSKAGYTTRLFAGGAKPLVTEQDFKARADQMFASGLFPTRQEAADAVHRQIKGFIDPSMSTFAPGKPGIATLDSVGDWLSGVLPSRLRQAFYGTSENVGDLLGMKDAAAGMARKQEREKAQADLMRPDFGGETANGIASGAESFVQQAPGLAASIASGSSVPALAYMGYMTYGPAYSKYKARGAGTGMAMLGAGGEAATEVITERLPMGETLRALESASGGRWKQAAISALKTSSYEMQGEQAATFVQDAIDTAIANPNKTWYDFLAERPDAAYQTFVATLTQTAMTMGLGGGMRVAGQFGYTPPEQKQLRSEASAQLIEQLNKGAAASKVLARDPETFQSFIKSAAEGGPVTDVYIDANVLNQSGLAEQVLAASPAAADQYQEALATGGQVRIPIDEYAARIAPQEYAQQLLDDIRLQPEDMTRREAQVYAQSGAMQDLEAAVARIIGDKAQDDPFTASRDTVKQRVLDNLNSLGRFTPQKNELDATLIATRSATRAAQLGMTPEQFFDQYVLKVVAQGESGQVLNQFAGQGALTADLGALKAAQDRVAAGEDAETVRRDTGWHTGVDGKWRFEIDDSQAYIKGKVSVFGKPLKANADIASIIKANKDSPYRASAKLGSILHHPDLFKAYPDLANVEVWVEKDGSGSDGMFAPDSNIITVRGSLSGSEAVSVILHEIQHAIQENEGFASGGSLDSARKVAYEKNENRRKQINEEIEELGRLRSSIPTSDNDAYQRNVDKHKVLVSERDALNEEQRGLKYDQAPAAQAYKRLAGEVEARNTQSRANLTGAERNATSPQSTADVAERDQIVMFSKGLAEMVSDKPTGAEIAEAQRQLEGQLAIADRMIAERGGLFAPNGQPSKLNRHQWAQVRTENFKAWFGDWVKSPARASKVVDANGEPMVVYHGSRSTDALTEFVVSQSEASDTRLKRTKDGAYFTRNPDKAAVYAGQDGSTYPVYLNITNPKMIADAFGSVEVDAAQLRAEGFDGLWNPKGFPSDEIVAIRKNQIKSATGNAGTFSNETGSILYQPDVGPGPVKRGWFSPSTNTIALLKNADLSTFLHESGHYFFETDIAIAAEILRENGAFGIDTMTPGQQQILRDVSALLKWHGIEGDIASQIDQWSRMDFEERRAYHEKTAESFERYLMEGKAPSIELQPVFQTFRQWLISVYKSIKDFLKRNPDAGELNPEVRAVFDRMLATEEEIKLAEQARGMLPLFADAMNAGMTPAEFADYQKLGNEATQAAIDELQAKGIRDMKWLANARSRMLKKLQKQAKAQRAEMRAAARTDVLSEPVYQAWNLLTSKMTDEDKLAGKKKRSEAVDPAVDSLFEAIAKLGGLSRETLVAQWGIDPKDKAESGLFGKPVMRAKDGGRSLDWMVEALTEDGYLTPDENGKGDVLDLEERFRAELRGDRQYSSIRNWETEPLPGEGQDLGGITAARIDRASLDAMEDLPQEVIDRLESLGMTAKTGGIHPDVLSEVLPGWTSGDELVRALASAVPLKEAIEARTDQWMLEQYADMATPDAIERAADMAIHNDARERFLLAEHKALTKASGDKSQRQIMLTAARDYARQLIGRQRIRDIRPGQYTAAEARAAKAAATSKDVAQKATEKRNQILSGMAARESYRAQDDVAKALRYLKKFDSPTIRKRVSGDYVDQIEALLEKIDLRKRSLKYIDRRKSFGAFVRSQIEKGVVPAMSDSLLPPGLRAAYQAKVMERDENGELIVRDDVEQAKVLADYLDMAETRSYKDMTVEEFRGLVETVRQIEHLGRKKKSLLTARDGATYEQKRDELVASVAANSEHLPDRMNRTVPSDRDEKLRGLRDFRISLRKIGMIMRLLDGNKDGGPMWDFFVRSANERGDWETEQIANASEALTNALRPVFTLKGGMRGKGIHFEGIGRSLNREQRIGLALNVGNDGNLQRLLDGEGWTYADIQPVLESLTAAEWQAVQDVWDYMDSYRPMIAAIEKRTVGDEPEWVQPMQFTVNTKDGQTLTLKGGYYPVKYDTEASQRAEELMDAEDAKRAMNAATNSSTTHRSFVKKRSEAVVGRPLELSLSAMYSGVQDVIHDLAWREWLIDASKMISSGTLDDAIRRKYGAETPRAIRQWISDIAAGTRKPRGVFDRAAAFLRKNVAASGLALNFMNAVQNVTGLQNSIERIGAKWLAVGQKEYLSGPKEAATWVQEKSSFMAHRARTQFRDLNELRNVVESGDSLLTKAKNNQFILITMTQKMVDTPTWIGAYRKAEAEGAVVQMEDGSIDDSKAVAMADQAVIDAQGSGMIKDLSAVERGGELAKLFTAYYSYMNTTYNLAANRVSGARGGSPRERGAAALRLLALMAVPVMLMAVLKSGLTPGDDEDWDDPEKLAKKLAMEQASFAMGLIPMAREFTPMIQPFLQDQTFGYQGPAGLRIIGDATKFTQQASQGDFDDGFRKAAVGLSGSLFGLPAAQINRTWTGVEALADDKTDNPGALMFGYQE